MLGGVPIYDSLEVSFLSVSITVLRVGLNILTVHPISHPLLNHLDLWLPLSHLAPPAHSVSPCSLACLGPCVHAGLVLGSGCALPLVLREGKEGARS